jgi:hypothetical protein
MFQELVSCDGVMLISEFCHRRLLRTHENILNDSKNCGIEKICIQVNRVTESLRIRRTLLDVTMATSSRNNKIEGRTDKSGLPKPSFPILVQRRKRLLLLNQFRKILASVVLLSAATGACVVMNWRSTEFTRKFNILTHTLEKKAFN